MADVAAASGVSTATVSLVLRDKPGVGEETRQRVLDAAQSLGYIVKPALQAAHPVAARVGVIVKVRPDDIPAANSFYAPVLAGIEAVCRANQINLMYANMPVDVHNNPIDPPRLLTGDHTDGLLLVGMLLGEGATSLLARQQAPVVLVDSYAPGTTYDAVVTDNVAGAATATRHLIARGHRRIAIVGSEPEAFPSIQERRAGYLQAMGEADLPPCIVDCPLHPDAAAPAVTALLHAEPEVTAIFGCNDEVAIAAMRAAQALGRAIPTDLSVVGFDNIAITQHVTPTLTTMRVDKMGMGRLAAQLLINRITHPQAGPVRGIICPQLIERHSVA